MPLSFQTRHLMFAVTALVFVLAGTTEAQLPFFPGAEGYGGAFSGSAPAGGWFSDAAAEAVNLVHYTLASIDFDDLRIASFSA